MPYHWGNGGGWMTIKKCKKLSMDDLLHWCYTLEEGWEILHEEALHQEIINQIQEYECYIHQMDGICMFDFVSSRIPPMSKKSWLHEIHVVSWNGAILRLFEIMVLDADCTTPYKIIKNTRMYVVPCILWWSVNCWMENSMVDISSCFSSITPFILVKARICEHGCGNICNCVMVLFNFFI